MTALGSDNTSVIETPGSTIDHFKSANNTTESQPDTSTNGSEVSKAPESSSNTNSEASQQKKKRKVGVACVYCRRSHMICDEGRPCQRCIKRKIEHLCHDEPANTKGRKRKNKADENQDQALQENQQKQPETFATPIPPGIALAPSGKINSVPTLGIYNSSSTNINDPNNGYLEGTRGYEARQSNTNIQNQLKGPTTSLNQQPFFFSEHAGSEFNSLTEFLSMIDDNDMINSINLNNDPTLHKLETTNSHLGSFENSTSNFNALGSLSGTASHNTSMFFNASMLPQFSNPNSTTNLPHFNNANNNGGNNFNNTNSQLSVNNYQQLNQQQLLNAYGRASQSSLNQTQMSPELQNNQLLLQQQQQQIQQLQNQQQQDSQQFPQQQQQQSNSALNTARASHVNSSTQTPAISDSARDKFFLTAADPTTEISPEERLKQVINAKLEAGLLRPYNYAKGYARLQTYMDNHMNSTSRKRILKPLSTFRPGFRAIAKTLKDIDLILVEENFERMLLDYDRVFTSMAIPACLWRRTGEIYRGNKEFASLVEVSIDDLKNGKLTIYELMTEESSVNFWEKYGSIAFDKTQKAVLSSCNLRTKDGRKKKNCCFSFTIRRDKYNIPSCIVGNFIPISN